METRDRSSSFSMFANASSTTKYALRQRSRLSREAGTSYSGNNRPAVIYRRERNAND